MLFLASQTLVVMAGLFRAMLAPPHTILPVFLALQACGTISLIVRCRQARAVAALFSVATLGHALFAVFVASMAFTNTWL